MLLFLFLSLATLNSSPLLLPTSRVAVDATSHVSKEEWHAVRETHAKPIELRGSQLILGRHAFIHPPFEEAEALGGPPLIARHVS
jgi:hypothetical protein